MGMKRITVMLDDELLAGLQAKAAETGATTAGQIRAAVRLWLREQVKPTVSEF